MRGKIRLGLTIHFFLFVLLLLNSPSAMAQGPPPPDVTLMDEAVKTREEGSRTHYLYKEAPVVDLSLPLGDLDYAGLDFKALSLDPRGRRGEVTYFLPISSFEKEGGAWRHRLDSRALDWEGRSWSFSFRTRLEDGRASAWREMEGFLDLDREDGRPDLASDPRPLGRDNGVWVFDRPFQMTVTVWDDQAIYYDDAFYLSRADNEGGRQAIPLKKLEGKVQATFEVKGEGSHLLYLFLKDGSGRPIPDPWTGDWPLALSYRIEREGGGEESGKDLADRPLSLEETARAKEGAARETGDKKKKEEKDQSQAPKVKAGEETVIKIEGGHERWLWDSLQALKKDFDLNITSSKPLKAEDLRPVVTLNGQALEAAYQVRAVSDNKMRLRFPKDVFQTEGIYRGRLKAPGGGKAYDLFAFYLDPKPPQIRPIRGFDRARHTGDRLALELEIHDMGGLQEVRRIVDGRTETILLNGERTYTDRFYLEAADKPHRIAYRMKDLAGNVTDTRSPAFKPPPVFESSILVKGRGSPYLFWASAVTALLLAAVLIFRRLPHLHKFHL